MAEIINLRMARKAQARTKAEAQSAANRVKHGQTKAERQKQQMDAARAARQLDGAEREKD